MAKELEVDQPECVEPMVDDPNLVQDDPDLWVLS